MMFISGFLLQRLSKFKNLVYYELRNTMSIESQKEGSGSDIIETLALFLSGRIQKGDLSENNQVTLDYYLGLMSEDRKFAARVGVRTDQLRDKGKRIPLFEADDLKKAKKHRVRKTSSQESFTQPSLLPNLTFHESEDVELGEINDPEENLVKLHRSFSSRYGIVRKKLLQEDVQYRRNELRSKIGLPIARGKDPNVKNPFYRFLVKRIVTFDLFDIFGEYDRSFVEISPELELKIQQVRSLTGELLSGELNMREKFKRFDEFKHEYQDKWGLEDAGPLR